MSDSDFSKRSTDEWWEHFRYANHINNEFDTVKGKLSDLQSALVTHNASASRAVYKNYNSSNFLKYIQHGFCRRLSSLLFTSCAIFREFPPDQEFPLDLNLRPEIQVYLEAFLVNLCGAFDNLALAFVSRHQLQLPHSGVGFWKRGREALKPYLPSAIQRQCADFKSWHDEYLKVYRDALTHQIPPYIPPYQKTSSNDQEACPLFYLDAFNKEGVPNRKYLHFHGQLICDLKTLLAFAEVYFAHWHQRADEQATQN